MNSRKQKCSSHLDAKFEKHNHHTWHNGTVGTQLEDLTNCKILLILSSRMFCTVFARNVNIIVWPMWLWYNWIKVFVSTADSFQSNVEQRMTWLLHENTYNFFSSITIISCKIEPQSKQKCTLIHIYNNSQDPPLQQLTTQNSLKSYVIPPYVRGVRKSISLSNKVMR